MVILALDLVNEKTPIFGRDSALLHPRLRPVRTGARDRNRGTGTVARVRSSGLAPVRIQRFCKVRMEPNLWGKRHRLFCWQHRSASSQDGNSEVGATPAKLGRLQRSADPWFSYQKPSIIASIKPRKSNRMHRPRNARIKKAASRTRRPWPSSPRDCG